MKATETTRPWALVTGASDGIGVEFCKQLGERNYNLILVARREAKLNEVAAHLRDTLGVETRVVACDLAAPRAAEDLHRRVRELGIEVDVLVNNAGLLFNGYFDELDLAGQEAMLEVNVVALTSLTHRFVSDMLARGRGRVLNVASTASWIGIPLENVYAASKAYVLSFTLALADELRRKNRGVTATVVCPSYTDTKMLDNPAQGMKLSVPGALVLQPDDVARQGVEACLRGRPIAIPGFSNRLGMALVQALPRTWVTRMFGALYQRGMK